MTLRMPPRYYNTPTRARFRKYPLPAELWDTWELLNALSWVNDYKFTPPTSSRDLAHCLGISEDALYDRAARLERLHWLTVDRQKGKMNVYHPLVPEDTLETVEDCDSCAESASLIPALRGEDSSRVPGNGNGNTHAAALPMTELPTSGVHATSANSTVVVALQNSDSDKTTTTNSTTPAPEKFTLDERVRLEAAFDELGIGRNAWDELCALEWMSVEYAEAWVAHKRAEGRKLGGGFYRMEMREGRESPYPAQTESEPPYVLKREDFTPGQWDRLLPTNRESVLEGCYWSDGVIR